MAESPPGATGVPVPQPIPWEQAELPFFKRLVDTVLLLVARPTEAFERMPTAAPIGRPLLYAVIVGWISIFFSSVWNLLLQGVTAGFLPETPPDQQMMVRWVYLLLIVVAPAVVVVGLFIWAGIIHLFLLLFGAGKSGFVATLRVGCYAHTVQLLAVVPFCGGLVAAVWSLVLQILGLATAHKTTPVKAALAVLLPPVLCCVCFGGLYLAGIAAYFGSAR